MIQLATGLNRSTVVTSVHEAENRQWWTGPLNSSVREWSSSVGHDHNTIPSKFCCQCECADYSLILKEGSRLGWTTDWRCNSWYCLLNNIRGYYICADFKIISIMSSTSRKTFILWPLLVLVVMSEYFEMFVKSKESQVLMHCHQYQHQIVNSFSTDVLNNKMKSTIK